MKKTLAILLVFGMILSMTGCGARKPGPGAEPQPQSPVKAEEPEKKDEQKNEASNVPAAEKKDTEPEIKEPEPAAVRHGVSFGIESYPQDAAQKAVIKGINENNGDVLWTYETDVIYETELQMIQEIGLCASGYMFLAGGAVYCLDPVTGEALWINDGFGGASASWCFDDSGNIYLCGYYGPELCVIDPEGQIVYDYYTLSEDNGMSECFWPCSIALDGDGLVEIGYDSNGMLLIVDPESGWMVDYDINSAALDPGLLAGSWITDNGSGYYALLEIRQDMSYSLYLLDSAGMCKYTYEGCVEISEWDEGSGKNDWVRFMLKATDDPTFKDWISIGEYRSLEMIEDAGGGLYFSLIQVNNGDSFWSIYFDDTAPFFIKQLNTAG